MSFKYDNLTKSEWCELLTQNPFLISLVPEQTEELQIACIESEEIETFELFRELIPLFKKPTEEVINKIINSQEKDEIEFKELDIRNLSYDFIKKLLISGYLDILDISDVELLKKLIDDEIYFSWYGDTSRLAILSNNKENFIKKCAYNDPDSVLLNKPELRKIAISSFYNSISYIPNLTREEIIYSIKKNPSSIKYIYNPDEELQLLAVSLYPETIEFIGNPTYKVQNFIVDYCKDDLYNYTKYIPKILTPNKSEKVLNVIKKYKYLGNEIPSLETIKNDIKNKKAVYLGEENILIAVLNNYNEKIFKLIIENVEYLFSFLYVELTFQFLKYHIGNNKEYIKLLVSETSYTNEMIQLFELDLDFCRKHKLFPSPLLFNEIDEEMYSEIIKIDKENICRIFKPSEKMINDYIEKFKDIPDEMFFSLPIEKQVKLFRFQQPGESNRKCNLIRNIIKNNEHHFDSNFIKKFILGFYRPIIEVLSINDKNIITKDIVESIIEKGKFNKNPLEYEYKEYTAFKEWIYKNFSEDSDLLLKLELGGL